MQSKCKSGSNINKTARQRIAVIEDQSAWKSPIIIGGVGGSGTRMIAELLQSTGVNIGSALNESLDNLWFTLLFRRSSWKKERADTLEILRACRVLSAAHHGEGYKDIPLDVDRYITDLAENMPDFGLKGSPFESWLDVSRHFLNHRYNHNTDGLWGWKEPNSHMFLPELLVTFPRLKYVHVIRNGVYMSQSSNQNQLNQWGLWFGDEVDAGGDVSERSSQFWCASNLNARRVCESSLADQHFWLKFEDLCSDPKSVATDLLAFVGVEPESDKIEGFCNKIDSDRGNALKIDRYLQMYDLNSDEFAELGYSLDYCQFAL